MKYFHLSTKWTFGLLFAAAMHSPAQAERWLWVKFCQNGEAHQLGNKFPDWSTVLRHPTLVRSYIHPSDPSKSGLTGIENFPKDSAAFIGISGSSPIEFRKGHKVIVTVFNPSSAVLHAGASISFTNPGSRVTATWDKAYNTMYKETAVGPVMPSTFAEFVFNITDGTNQACPEAKPVAGMRHLVNIHTSPQLVVTKIELSDEADTTAPNPIADLKVEASRLTNDVEHFTPKLTWTDPGDPPEPNSTNNGVSRYFIYRDGTPHDIITREWTAYFGKNAHYYDLSAVPGKTYDYKVTALDNAITGLNPILANIATQRSSNESKGVSVKFTVPKLQSNQVLDPFNDLIYAGAFRLPEGDYAHGGQALAYSPKGNAEPQTQELAGNLYIAGHDHRLYIGSISIPEPAKGAVDQLPVARELLPLKDTWPKIYEGASWIMKGSVSSKVGLAYHPGVDGKWEGLYYGLFRSYSGDLKAPAHGYIAPDLTNTQAAWHIGGKPGTPEHLPFTLTGKFITAVPQGFADKHFQGRSLLVGLGWPISGHGWPAGGPSLFATQPWESGALPEHEQAVSALQLLQYDGGVHPNGWMTNWNENRAFNASTWVDAGRQAIVFSGSRTRGDEWYGGENGYESSFCDGDRPTTYGNHSFKGQSTTEHVPALFFYNPEDLWRVANGQLKPWQPQPYAILDVKDLLQTRDIAMSEIRGITYSKELNKLFLYESQGGGKFGRGLIHVWEVKQTAYNPPVVGLREWRQGKPGLEMKYDLFHGTLILQHNNAGAPNSLTLYDARGKRIVKHSLAPPVMDAD